MNKRNKKIFSSATAMVAVLAILVSGTLAFLGGAAALNRFRDFADKDQSLTGANLHDDFAGINNADADGIVDKDVYVENTGDKDVFVRIKLSEELNGGGKVLYTPVLNGTGLITKAGNVDGFTWKLGSTTPKDYRTITNTTAWNDTDEYPTGTTAGAKRELVADALGAATVAKKADTSSATIAGQTLDQNGVISMQRYMGMSDGDKAAFVGWIYDVDGYAYWSQPLAPGTATGLLLDSVKVPAKGSKTYTYDIIVDMEFVDIYDLAAWTNGATITSGDGEGGTTAQASNNAKGALAAIESRRGMVTLTPAQTGDTENWIEIARNGEYSLIVRAKVIGLTQYKPAIPFAAYTTLDVDTAGNLRYAINNWYDNTLDGSARLRSYVVGHDALTKPGTWASFDATNGFSIPTGVAATGTKADIAFPLSFQEAANYCSGAWYDGSVYTTGADTTVKNWNKFEDSTWTWLRSQANFTGFASTIRSTGNVGASDNVTLTTVGARPALWVKTDIIY